MISKFSKHACPKFYWGRSMPPLFSIRTPMGRLILRLNYNNYWTTLILPVREGLIKTSRFNNWLTIISSSTLGFEHIEAKDIVFQSAMHFVIHTSARTHTHTYSPENINIRKYIRAYYIYDHKWWMVLDVWNSEGRGDSSISVAATNSARDQMVSNKFRTDHNFADGSQNLIYIYIYILWS